jgi:hypothetical protein
MPRSLRVALLALLLVGLAVPLLRANSIPIGQMGVMGPGGCDSMHCHKAWVSVSIGGGLTDSHGMYFPLDLTGTFYIRDISAIGRRSYGAAVIPAFGIQVPRFSISVMSVPPTRAQVSVLTSR